MRKAKGANAGSKPNFTKPWVDKASPAAQNKQPQGNTATGNRRTWKTLSSKEMEEKRAKGLCYYCDEKFGPGHRCSKKLYRMDLCIEDCEGEEEVEEAEEEEVQEGPRLKYKLSHLQMNQASATEVRLRAISGEPHYDTINVTGDTGGGELILMLVDSGSTHNFLDARIAEQLGCELEEIKEFQVSLADGQLVKGSKKCSCLTWRMAGEYFQDEFLVLQ